MQRLYKHLCKLSVLLAMAWLASFLAISTSQAEVVRTRAINSGDRAQILDLIARYGHYFDIHEPEAWASLFTGDGELSFPLSTDPLGPRYEIKGHDQLVAFASYNSQPDQVGIHFPGPTILVRTGARRVLARTPVAIGVVKTNTFFGATFNGYGVYEDVIVKTKNGWRFKKRTADTYGALPISPQFLPGAVAR